jgi:hypothetical protein
MDRRGYHVATGPSERLGLSDRPLTTCPKLKNLLSFWNLDVGVFTRNNKIVSRDRRHTDRIIRQIADLSRFI